MSKKRFNSKKNKKRLRKLTWKKLHESFNFSPNTNKFILPFTDISHPLRVDGNNLKLSLIEVGCRHCRKPAKLRETRKLVHDFWTEYYQNQAGLDWMPEVFRVLAHYNTDCNIPPTQALKDSYVDSIVHYHTITEQMLGSLTPGKK